MKQVRYTKKITGNYAEISILSGDKVITAHKVFPESLPERFLDDYCCMVARNMYYNERKKKRRERMQKLAEQLRKRR